MRQGQVCVALLFAGLLAGSAGAQVAPLPAPVPGPAAQPKVLAVGDTAPALDIGTWVKGDSVKSFEKGKAYVVEFWATWCAPCRAMIPKLTAKQAKYGKKGVTVIGVSIDQGGDALGKVRAFVDAQGDKMAYTIALDAGGTGAAYLGATGVSGIPHAYIVDKNGKMVWHGNPALPSDGMELVLTEVADGTFDLPKHTARQAKFADLDNKFAAARQAGKWDEAEKALEEIEKIRPDITAIVAATHYDVIANGKKDQAAAMAYARKIIEAESQGDPAELLPLLDRVAGTPGLEQKDREFVSGLALKVVKQTGEKNSAAYSIYAETLVGLGKFDDAIAAMEKAVSVAGEEMEKRYYTDRLNTVKAKAAAAKGDGAKADPPKGP